MGYGQQDFGQRITFVEATMGFGQQSMKATKEFGQWITFKEEEGKSVRATKEFGNRITFEEEEGKSMGAIE